jgi:hypothetical protein
MKRTIFALATILVVFVALFAVLVLRPIPKVKAHHRGCSNRTLMGYYGFNGFGFNSVDPATLEGLLYFDGNGNLSGTNFYAVINGVPDPGNPNSFTGATYTVNPNCTMTASGISIFSATVSAYGVVVDAQNGEVTGDLVSSALNTTATFDVKKVQVPD